MNLRSLEDQLDELIEDAFGLGVEAGEFKKEDIITALEHAIIAIQKGMFDAS